ncbi:MAG: hypothetical protein K6F69_02315 [Treponema sp.]|nr:hypothetical protein [Treponema sp.]
MKKNLLSIVIGVIIALIIFIAGTSACSIVDPSERGVLVTLGEISGEVLAPGVHFHAPFISTIKKYSIVPKGINANFTVGKDGAITKDKQTVGSQVSAFYRYDESRIIELVKKYSDSIIENAITKSLIASVKETVGKYSIDELVENQDRITSEVNTSLETRLADYPVELTQLTISNWDWSDDFDAQIKETMNRTQKVKQEEQELNIEKTRHQKEVVEAEASANVKKINAEATKEASALEAEAVINKAKGEAEAKRIEADSIAYYNAQIAKNYAVEIKLKELEIELERAKKWDGREVPEYIPMTAAGTVVDLTKK